jgi:hypothetical protein
MTVAPKKQTFDRVTDEALAELRAEIGTEIKGPPGHITEATRDGIRHFAMVTKTRCGWTRTMPPNPASAD